jgi:hypothetical protein
MMNNHKVWFLTIMNSLLFKGHKALSCIGAVVLATLIALLFHHSLGWGFEFLDSPTILLQAAEYSPLDYFTSPSAYERLSTNNLTPWVTLSWHLDLLLFGLDAEGYRLHHLISFTLMMLAIYALLIKLCKSVIIALVSTGAILAIPATVEVASFLVDRHYIEGMILSLACIYCVLIYNDSKKYGWLLFSALFYALATTAKEIYVPLPGILFFILNTPIKNRVLEIIPYAVISLSYLAWRFYMLSGALGGYRIEDFSSPSITSFSHIAGLTKRVIYSLFDNKYQSLLLFAIFITAAAFNYKKLSINFIVGFMAGFICIIIPLVSLLPILSIGFIIQRWFFLPTAAILIILAYLCSISSKPLKVILIVLITAWSLPLLVKLNQGLKKPTIIAENLVSGILTANSAAYIKQHKYRPLNAHSTAEWINLN